MNPNTRDAVLAVLRESGPSTINEISQATGLSRITIDNAMKEMTFNGTAMNAGVRTVPRGRPSITWGLSHRSTTGHVESQSQPLLATEDKKERIMETLARTPGAMTIRAIALETAMSYQTTRKHLNDLLCMRRVVQVGRHYPEVGESGAPAWTYSIHRSTKTS